MDFTMDIAEPKAVTAGCSGPSGYLLIDGAIAITMPATRAEAMAAAFNGATAVDLADIPALRAFIQQHAFSAGLCCYERQEAAE